MPDRDMLEFSPGQVLGLCVTVVVIVLVLTVVLVFHYPQASSTTSVLGVVLPALTAVLGLVVGGGAGHAAGSACKQAVQGQLASTQEKLASAAAESENLVGTLTPMLSRLQERLPSEAGAGCLSPIRAAEGVVVFHPTTRKGSPLTSDRDCTSVLDRLDLPAPVRTHKERGEPPEARCDRDALKDATLVGEARRGSGG